MYYENCDSFSIAYSITPNGFLNFKFPYTATLTLPDGNTLTHTFTTFNSPLAIPDTFHFRYVHQSNQSRTITLNVVNNCGASYTSTYQTGALDMRVSFSLLTDCSRQYSYTFDIYEMNAIANNAPLHCNTITYTLISPSGTVLATQTNNSTFSGFPPGNGYKVVRQDCCMRDTIRFDWRSAPDLKINGYGLDHNNVYRDGITSVVLNITPANTGSIIIAEGPASVTYRNGTVHNYTYPDTLTNVYFSPAGVHIQAFTAGTWKAYAIDSCGQKDSVTFTIGQADLRRDTFTATLSRGCPGANQIIWNATTNAGTPGSTTGFVSIPGGYQRSYAFSHTDSITNLSSGTYTLNYACTASLPNTFFLKGINRNIADTIPVTINIPIYTQPAFASLPAVSVCGNIRTVALLPDNTTGAPPYQYSIISGSTTTPLQPGNLFSGLSTGTYRFLMADACGNSYSTNYTVDTLRLPGVATAGNTCQGGAAVLTLPVNPYYSYSWQLPNGNIFTGNALTLSPLTPADTGRYLITVNVNVNGCINSQTSAVRLNFCSLAIPLPLKLLHFKATKRNNTIVLHWKTADEINTSYFVAERSTDGIHFTDLQRIIASAISDGATYSVTDNKPLQGISYYRLRIVDRDGKKQYSKIISFDNNIAEKPDVYPTVVRNENIIYVTYPASALPAYIQVTGTDGQMLLTKPIDKGSLQTAVDVNTLPKGIYLVLVVHNGNRTVVKVVKQ